MDFKAEIEYWEDKNGHSPITDFLLKEVPANHLAWIKKRDHDFLEKLTVRELFSTPYLDWAEGVDYPLIEVRYLGKGEKNYRALAFVWNQDLIYLDFFKGSGSDGRLAKHFLKSITRAEDWKQRYPKAKT